MNPHYTYLFIDIASISIPLLWSFESKVRFVQYWKALLLSIFISGAIFIPWDVVFTLHGNWGFNERYLTGIYWFGLPIEEILFFICIPYASVFTHEALKYYLPKNPLEGYSKTISIAILSVLAFVFIFNLDKQYTVSASVLAISEILIFQFWLNSKDLSRIYFSYLVVLIPFFIVNGLLTGSLIEEEVVWYNNAENLGLRISTIPVDDLIYAFALLVLVMQLFEYFKSGKVKVLN